MEINETPWGNIRRRLTSIGKTRKRLSHIFARVQYDWYVEEAWVAKRLFDTVEFEGSIVDPCCGMGTIVKAARAAGYRAWGYDLVDRGFLLEQQINFMKLEARFDNVVMNPPFSLGKEFAEKAIRQTRGYVAMIWPTRRLNAASWIVQQGRPYTIMFLTPRPSMLPGEMVQRGRKAKGGREDFVWIVWTLARKHTGAAKWLSRDE